MFKRCREKKYVTHSQWLKLNLVLESCRAVPLSDRSEMLLNVERTQKCEWSLSTHV